MRYPEFDVLKGQTLVSITRTEIFGNDALIFKTQEGKEYHLYHRQDCCESVTLEDVIGNLDDLIGSPLLMAELVTQNTNPETGETKEYYSETWSFYKLATIKGYVTLRFYGESNGYYSETVDFEEV